MHRQGHTAPHAFALCRANSLSESLSASTELTLRRTAMQVALAQQACCSQVGAQQGCVHTASYGVKLKPHPTAGLGGRV